MDTYTYTFCSTSTSSIIKTRLAAEDLFNATLIDATGREIYALRVPEKSGLKKFFGKGKHHDESKLNKDSFQGCVERITSPEVSAEVGRVEKHTLSSDVVELSERGKVKTLEWTEGKRYVLFDDDDKGNEINN
jgi:hypothetical protein